MVRYALGAAALALAAGALVAVLLTRSDAAPELPPLGERGMTASASVTPRHHLFGDEVTARVDVVLDRRRLDPESVQVRTRFRPYAAVAPIRAERVDVGPLTRLRFVARVRCLGPECLAPRLRRGIQLAPSTVSADGERLALVQWPTMTTGSRVTPEAPGAESGAAPAWRLDIAEPPVPSFRVAPSLAAGILAGLAAVLVAAGAVLLWIAVRPARAGAPALQPLERALRLLEHARTGAEPREERKALDLLAVELARHGESDLASDASELAWARLRPDAEATEELSGRVGGLVRENGRRRA